MATKLKISKKRFEEIVEEEVKAFRRSEALVLNEGVTQGLFAQLLKTYSKRVKEFEQNMRETFQQLGLDATQNMDEKQIKKVIKKLTAHYFKFSSKLDMITNELLSLEEKLNLAKSEEEMLPPQELEEDNGDDV